VVVGHRDGVRVERVRLDDVGSRLEVEAVDLLDDLGADEGHDLAVVLEVDRMVLEARPAEVRLAEAVPLEHRPHGSVDDRDALPEEPFEVPGPAHPGG
jgi:hypothetical protein